MTRYNKKAIALIEEMCAKNPDSVRTMPPEDFEAFIDLSDDTVGYIVALLMMNFQDSLDKRILAGQLNSDEEICNYFLPYFELLFHGKIAFDDDNKMGFFQAIGEPNALMQKKFDAKLETWKPLIVNTFTEILKKSKQRSNLTQEQHNRFSRLKEEYEKNNIEGVFPPNGKLSPEEAATELWKHGYLLFPTVESLLDRLEKYLEDQKNGTITQGADYIFKWEMNFTVSNPRGIPVPAQYIRELKSVIETWIKEHGLETEDDIYTGKYEEET